MQCTKISIILSVALFIATPVVVLAVEPPYIYKEFGYSPPNNGFKELDEARKSELNSCISLAKEQAELTQKNSEKMAAIYGRQSLQYDYFGTLLTGCLSDEKDGKGWQVYQKVADDWKTVNSRQAARTFMQLSPEN